jgi:hypothetical protein
MKKLIIGTITTAALLIGGTSLAAADPAFGPGNQGGGVGNSQPDDGKCHPPGQTVDVPGCK